MRQGISTLGRITSGVKLINLDDNVKVATVSKVRKNPSDEDGNEAEEFSEEDNTKAADTSVAAEGDADNSLDELLDAAMKDNQAD